MAKVAPFIVITKQNGQFLLKKLAQWSKVRQSHHYHRT